MRGKYYNIKVLESTEKRISKILSAAVFIVLLYFNLLDKFFKRRRGELFLFSP